MTDLAGVGARETTQEWEEFRRSSAPRCALERLIGIDHLAEGVGASVLLQESLGGADDVQRTALTLITRVAPGGDAVSTEDATNRLRVRLLNGGDVESQLETGTTPRHPHHRVTKALGRQLLALGGGRERDTGVRMQVIHVGAREQTVHGGIDRWCGPASSVHTEVEGRDHLVLALGTGVDPHQGPQPVDAQHRQSSLLQRAEVAARTLDPHDLGVATGHGVGNEGLGRGVATGVVRVARVRTESVRAFEKFDDFAWRIVGGQGNHAPQPAAVPVARSAIIFSA